MNRLRGRLLAGLLAPIQSRLDGQAWLVADAILVRRIEPAALAMELGQELADVRRTLSERVLPAVINEFGGSSTEALLRLTGFRRS